MNTLDISNPTWKPAHQNILAVIEKLADSEHTSYRILKEHGDTPLGIPSFSYHNRVLANLLMQELKHDRNAQKILNELFCLIIPRYPEYICLSDLARMIEEHMMDEIWIIRN